MKEYVLQEDRKLTNTPAYYRVPIFIYYVALKSSLDQEESFLNPNSTNLPELLDLPRGGKYCPPPLLFQKEVV